jgi:hypothetical protein
VSIIDGKGLVTWEGGLFEPNSDLLRRLQWAFAQIRAAGGTIILNEAGRPFGVPSDANVHEASQTASGVSTVWFQWGRYLRHETPSAADPRSGNTLASEHTEGIASDTNAPTASDMALRKKYFAMVGMVQTIPSESWHFAIRGPIQPGITLPNTTTAGGGSVPIIERTDDDEMISKDTQDFLNAGFADIKSGIRREGRGRLYYCPNPPPELPNYICIFWDRDPADGRNILYGNAGEQQVRNWNEVYYQTADTVEQALAAPVRSDKFQALVDFAMGKDSAFTNNLASK